MRVVLRGLGLVRCPLALQDRSQAGGSGSRTKKDEADPKLGGSGDEIVTPLCQTQLSRQELPSFEARCLQQGRARTSRRWLLLGCSIIPWGNPSFQDSQLLLWGDIEELSPSSACAPPAGVTGSCPTRSSLCATATAARVASSPRAQPRSAPCLSALLVLGSPRGRQGYF